MLNLAIRRSQKYLGLIKLLIFALSALMLSYLVFLVPPDIYSVSIFSVLLLLSLYLFLEFIFHRIPKVRASYLAFIIALSVSFLFFLKAVNLLTTINLLLFTVFIVLISLHLYHPSRNK